MYLTKIKKITNYMKLLRLRNRIKQNHFKFSIFFFQPILKFMFSTIKATFLHIINPRQILLTPFALYSGLLLSFGFNELTRAFGSCMIGVEQVGCDALLKSNIVADFKQSL